MFRDLVSFGVNSVFVLKERKVRHVYTFLLKGSNNDYVNSVDLKTAINTAGYSRHSDVTCTKKLVIELKKSAKSHFYS